MNQFTQIDGVRPKIRHFKQIFGCTFCQIIVEFQWGSRGLKVKFKFSLSPEANIVMYIHIHGNILTGYRPKVYLAESPN